MIPADKSRFFEKWFTLYNERWLIKRYFYRVYMRGESDPVSEGQPVLYLMNHSSWWDGLLVYAVVRQRSKRQHYMMMDEEQLAKYRFFRRIGAFSIDKQTVSGIAQSLRYAENLLKQGHSVWLFPQGDIRHLEERPLNFKNGAAYLLSRVPEAAVIPVTAYYSFGVNQKPEAGLWFGAPLDDSELAGLKSREVTYHMSKRVQDQLDEHRRLAIKAVRGESMTGFYPLFPGSETTDSRFMSLKRRFSQWRSYFGR
ncbi:lysophospholipid acyltransferase family protein [Paenibacillus glycanilyticus]|uniref:lysophospholipid acyltransferase family protein n=1 Tax=Paenibacillus glycanilyticus TaxID=126569 RepID=UPI003EBDA34B